MRAILPDWLAELNPENSLSECPEISDHAVSHSPVSLCLDHEKNVELEPQIGGEMLVLHAAWRASVVDKVMAQALNQVQPKGVAHLDAWTEQVELPDSIAKQGLVQCLHTLFTDILDVQQRRRLQPR